MTDVLEPPDEPGRSRPAVEQDSPSRSLAGLPPVDVRPVDVDAAFSDFYRAEIKRLVNFLLWMGAGVADAADLAQDTMIDAYRSWPSVRHPRAWVRRVASRKYIRRRISPDETATDLTDDHNPLLGAPSDITAWERRHEVFHALAKLPPRQRQVLAWSLDGYQPQEIATELNITAPAVRGSLKLARRALAELLYQAGGTE
jgi:RNA polymerase sigma factor (sigma-70 family)